MEYIIISTRIPLNMGPMNAFPLEIPERPLADETHSFNTQTSLEIIVDSVLQQHHLQNECVILHYSAWDLRIEEATKGT